jgi:predicted RNA-binding protein Jag
MNSIERTGASIEEVIRNYKKEFKVKEWELRYDVITRPSSGFLGLGRKKAKLRFHQDDLHVASNTLWKSCSPRWESAILSSNPRPKARRSI